MTDSERVVNLLADYHKAFIGGDYFVAAMLAGLLRQIAEARAMAQPPLNNYSVSDAAPRRSPLNIFNTSPNKMDPTPAE